MFNHFLSAVLRGAWLVEESFAHSQLPIIASLLEGKLNGQEMLSGNSSFEMPFYILKNGSKQPAFSRKEGVFYCTAHDLKEPAIAVMPVIGAVTKYNGECGEPGLIKRQGWIAEMVNSPNVVGYISLLDTPGGQADGTPQFADSIKNLSIPTAAIIVGGALSAGAWIASAHNVIYAADKYSKFGSIGAFTTIADFRGYFEKQGIKIQYIYPEVSKDKNRSYRLAIDGDTTLIEVEIGLLAQSFIDAFAENRGSLLNNDSWNTGKCFSAEECVSIGLIDGVLGFNQVVEMLFANQISNQNSKMDIGKIKALAGDSVSQEALAEANAELATAGVTNVVLVEETVIEEASRVTSENTVLKQQLTSTKSDLSTAQTALAEAQATIETQKELIAKTPGAVHTNTAGEDDLETVDKSAEEIIAELPHNKAAAELLG